MKMGIFVACVGRQDGGPETYERHLVENLVKLGGDTEFHVFCFNERAVQAFSLNGHGSRVTFHRLWPDSRWASLPVSLPVSLKLSGVELYHATFVPAPFAATPLVFTMHDVSPFTHPEFYPKAIRRRLNPVVERGLKNARLIICISEHSRQTTAEYFNIPLERTTVVHLGVNPNLAPVPANEARARLKAAYGLDGEYLLYVGKLEARKNIVRLIEAFAQVREECGFQGDLVLAGRRFWDLDGIDEATRKYGVQDRVRELGYVPDEDLAPLYSEAAAFVFPSLWEGFGFPVLEAMACGAPVVASAVSSLPEIAGDAAVLVDPTSTESIAQGIAQVIASPSTAGTLRERGLRRAAEFTWDRTARKTMDAYHRARDL